METKLERLIKQRAELVNERSAVSIKLRAEKCAIQRHRRSAADEWQVPRHVMASALLIYMECGWAVEPAVKFLLAHGASKRWRKLKGAVVQEMLESEFLAFEESELLGLRAAHATRDDRSAQRAETYIAEWRLVAWCRSMNAKHGVAPSTADVIKKARELVVTGAAALHARTNTGRPNNIARKWASRFRVRNNLKGCFIICVYKVQKEVGRKDRKSKNDQWRKLRSQGEQGAS